MNLFLVFGGMFVISVVVAGFITRFIAREPGPLSEEEKRKRREAALRTAERNRKIMQWVTSAMLCALAVVAVVSWFSRDPWSKEFGLYFAGAFAVPILVLWAKTRDDGLNPQLRKKPNQALEPTATAVASPAAQEPRQP